MFTFMEKTGHVLILEIFSVTQFLLEDWVHPKNNSRSKNWWKSGDLWNTLLENALL